MRGASAIRLPSGFQRIRWIPVLVLSSLALGSGWLAHRLSPPPVPTDAAPRQQEPDYFLETFTTTTMDASGRPERRISAERLLHFPDTNTNELVAPHLTLFHPTKPAWHIESERGWISATGEVVLLLGKVHGWRDRHDGERSLDLRTRDLRILSESDYAETDKPVVIKSRTSVTRGIGMRAFLRESRIELLAQVTTRVERRNEPN